MPFRISRCQWKTLGALFLLMLTVFGSYTALYLSFRERRTDLLDLTWKLKPPVPVTNMDTSRPFDAALSVIFAPAIEIDKRLTGRVMVDWKYTSHPYQLVYP